MHSFPQHFLMQRITAMRVLTLIVLSVVMLVLQVVASVAPAYATGAYDFLPPAANEWVVDQADILSRLSQNRINSLMSEVSQKTGNQVHIVTVHRLDYGETIDSLASQLFEQWFPTPEAQANQVLLVLDNVTNTSAIRVGEAAAARLTAAIAESVAQETLLVPIRKGNYNQALLDASNRIALVLMGKPDPGAPVVADNVQVEGTFADSTATKKNKTSSTVWVIGLLVAATVIPMATYYFYLYLQSQS
ncbi:MAG: TPM domain-containing protein [Cyanobacteria bacterium]|nr:TPM domain-containing protein [Cyanobacteriota bacterium]